MKKLISLLIVLFLFSGFSISQVGETEATKVLTLELKVISSKKELTPKQKLNWEKAKQEAVEKREAILTQKANVIDKFYKKGTRFLGYSLWMSDSDIEKFVVMLKEFCKQREEFGRELKIFETTTSIGIPIKSYIKGILKNRKSEIDKSFNDFCRNSPNFITHYSKMEKLVNEIKKFRKMKSKLGKEFEKEFVKEINIPVECYAKTILENEKLSIEEYLQAMNSDGKIVKNEVIKLEKRIETFDKLKKKLKRKLKIPKEKITVKIPEDWRKIHAISFFRTWVHFKDDKKENIRKIIAKWTGQDTKVVKANRYDLYRIAFALIIGIIVFAFSIWISSRIIDKFTNEKLWNKILSRTSMVIGLAVGICYFFLY